MRADRLLALLMLLQNRGRMTARALAEELEVSERTIYRDMDALSAARVPVCAERGPGGGCFLLDGYRTNLTGLKEDEVRALFMLSIPAALTELGVGGELKSALMKLSAALPAGRRRSEEWIRQRIHLDWSWWFRTEEPVPHLRTMQQAVWEDRRLRLVYRLEQATYDRMFTRTVAPYGLVAKAGVWYLVCSADGRVRVYRMSRLVDAQLLEERFERPDDFDLPTFWSSWCAEYESNRPHYAVRARVSPELATELPQHFGERIRGQIEKAGSPDDDGWIILTLPFETLNEARARLLGFGGAVEVLEPRPLRRSLADFADRIAAVYRS